MADQPLFEQPQTQPVVLSRHFDNFTYRAVKGSKISYRKRTMKRFHSCEECAYLQHETGGQFRPKRAVKYRRNGPGDCTRCKENGKPVKHLSHIDLCNEHARLWQERDSKDMCRG